jgi:amidase
MELFFRSVMDSEPWLVDADALNIPWRRVISPPRPKLRFGLIMGEKSTRPLHPPLLKTMTRLSSALESKGHTIVKLDEFLPSLYDLGVLASKMFGYDPQHTPAQRMQRGNDPLVECVRRTLVPETAGWEGTLDDLWDINLERTSVVNLFHDLVVKNDLDGILMAGFQSTSAPHDECGLPLYTLPWNLVDVSFLFFLFFSSPFFLLPLFPAFFQLHVTFSQKAHSPSFPFF